MPELPIRETARAAEAFERYSALGPGRSLSKLARLMVEEAKGEAHFPVNPRQTPGNHPVKAPTLETILRQLEVWSSAHRWQERVRAYDREKAQELQREREERIRQVNENHVTLARGQTIRAVKEIEHLASVHKLTGQAAVTLFKYAVDLERTALGIPTTVQEQTFSVAPEPQDDASPDLARLIRSDPEATRLVCLLYDRLTLGSSGRDGLFGLEHFLAHRANHLEHEETSQDNEQE